ncbi:MAG: hypothetical protein K2K93_07655 [Muribaculaceae bacterium]|nr:hypothetical protein [Muribaculaceae bacterium]
MIAYTGVGFCVAVRLSIGNARRLKQQDGNRYRFLRFFIFQPNANEGMTAAK